MLPTQQEVSCLKIIEVRSYDRAGCVIFRKTNEEFGGLSNMAGGYPLHIGQVRIRSAEALYQACRYPHMPEVQQLIINQVSPMTAKMKGKPYRSRSRTDWDVARVRIMKWCLRVKLAQHWVKFGSLLLSTGVRPIVEESSKDDFWGAIPQTNGRLVGANVLGRLLMELREQLRSSSWPELKTVRPPAIPEFQLLGNSIEPIVSQDSLSPAEFPGPEEPRPANSRRDLNEKLGPTQISLLSSCSAPIGGLSDNSPMTHWEGRMSVAACLNLLDRLLKAGLSDQVPVTLSVDTHLSDEQVRLLISAQQSDSKHDDCQRESEDGTRP